MSDPSNLNPYDCDRCRGSGAEPPGCPESWPCEQCGGWTDAKRALWQSPQTTSPALIGPRERAIAQWSVNLDVDCPFCGESIDLLVELDGDGISPLVDPWTSERRGEAWCKECRSDFEFETRAT